MSESVLRWAALCAGLLAVGCLKLPPHLRYRIEMRPEAGLVRQAEYYFDPEDSTTVFQHEGLRLKVRFLSDAELNREYARRTFREPNLNPFTYGRDRDLDLGYTPPRFAVFQVELVNQSYPKVMIDPARMRLRTDRGGVYDYWGVLQREAPNSFEAYYMARRGEGGNEEYYYNERLGIVREALYRRHTFVFKGESYSGKVVFAPLHRQVRRVVLEVKDIVLRVDAFDRPIETVEAEYSFAVEQKIVGAEEAASPAPLQPAARSRSSRP